MSGLDVEALLDSTATNDVVKDSPKDREDRHRSDRSERRDRDRYRDGSRDRDRDRKKRDRPNPDGTRRQCSPQSLNHSPTRPLQDRRISSGGGRASAQRHRSASVVAMQHIGVNALAPPPARRATIGL